MSEKVEIQHAAPVDVEYMNRFRDAIKEEASKLRDVFKTALLSAGPPPTQQAKTPETMWQELQLMAATGDPALYGSDPADPNSAITMYKQLAPRFGASPIPQQPQVFPGGRL